MTACPISTVHNGDTRDDSFSDASGSESSATDNVIKRHPQSGQPAQTAPGGIHHPGLAGFPLTDGTFVHIQSVRQLNISQGDKVPDQQDFGDSGLLPVFSADQRITIEFSGFDKIIYVPLVVRIHSVSACINCQKTGCSGE